MAVVTLVINDRVYPLTHKIDQYGAHYVAVLPPPLTDVEADEGGVPHVEVLLTPGHANGCARYKRTWECTCGAAQLFDHFVEEVPLPDESLRQAIVRYLSVLAHWTVTADPAAAAEPTIAHLNRIFQHFEAEQAALKEEQQSWRNGKWQLERVRQYLKNLQKSREV